MTDARRTWTGKRVALLIAAVSCVVGVFFVLPLEWRQARLDRVEGALAEAARSGITTAHVRVEAVDFLTGSPVPLDEIRWSRGGEHRFVGFGVNQGRRDETTGTLEFDAPLGEVWILPDDGRFCATTTRLVVLPILRSDDARIVTLSFDVGALFLLGIVLVFFLGPELRRRETGPRGPTG